ncbi:aa3-type cytochrome oxidase subunit IV [Nocardioides alcanivorans]|nr:cytochrome c oxidase subunit 4 [Nocardioides alcanivorans]
MKAETWLFVTCGIFFVLVAPAYWFVTDAMNEQGVTGSARPPWS